MKCIGHGWQSATDGWRCFIYDPPCRSPTKACHLSCSEEQRLRTWYIRNIYNLFIFYIWFPAMATTFSLYLRQSLVAPSPRCNFKVIEWTWRLKIPRNRSCEHPRLIDITACVLADRESKIVSRTCGPLPQPTSTTLISANMQKSHFKTFQIGSIR